MTVCKGFDGAATVLHKGRGLPRTGVRRAAVLVEDGKGVRDRVEEAPGWAGREDGLEAGAGPSVAPRVQALGAGRGMSILGAGSNQVINEPASGGVDHLCPPLQFGQGTEPWTKRGQPRQRVREWTGARDGKGHFCLHERGHSCCTLTGYDMGLDSAKRASYRRPLIRLPAHRNRTHDEGLAGQMDFLGSEA